MTHPLYDVQPKKTQKKHIDIFKVPNSQRIGLFTQTKTCNNVGYGSFRFCDGRPLRRDGANAPRHESARAGTVSPTQAPRTKIPWEVFCFFQVLIETRNILDETKDTFGSVVDRNVGESIDAGKRQAGLSAHAKDVLNQMSSGTGDMGIKGNEAMGEGFKVGEKADLHALAQSKQP